MNSNLNFDNKLLNIRNLARNEFFDITKRCEKNEALQFKNNYNENGAKFKTYKEVSYGFNN